MKVKQVICLGCPIACNIEVKFNDVDDIKDENISNHRCKRGIEYAKSEVKNPTRMLTTTVKIQSEILELLPVQTSKPIDKGKLLECMDELAKVRVAPPIDYNQVVLENILDTGVDIVSTTEVKR